MLLAHTQKSAKDLLLRYTDEVTISGLREACESVIETPKFYTQYGSAGAHHAYEGGLIVHTAEVTDIAMNIGKLFSDADEDVLITAAIFHDFMKIKDYKLSEDGKIEKTDYRMLVRHVAGSYAAFLMAIQNKNVPSDLKLKIEHAILAHHGRREYGSPVEPQMIEAMIIHQADKLSADYGVGSKTKFYE